MAFETLRDLYIDELKDLYDAEQQILKALPSMASATASKELKSAFERHLEQSKIHVQRLELIFKQSNLSPAGKPCKGVEGLIKEGNERLKQRGAPDVVDAALIGAAQRVEHYEMAGYGCARTYARLLGEWESARLLQQTLDEEGETDKQLTRLAESGINEAASEGAVASSFAQQSRLRYVDVDDIDTSAADYSDFTILNRAGDDLGTLDGFVVESGTGRPFYFVVDSGGWFLGRRYLVPVGQSQLDRGNKTLRIDLDKDTIKRYPEFSGNAFLSMTDDEVRRYERRIIEAVQPGAAREAGQTWDYNRLPQYQQPEWLTSSAWLKTEPFERSATASGASASSTAAARQSRADRDQFASRDTVVAHGEQSGRSSVTGESDRAGQQDLTGSRSGERSRAPESDVKRGQDPEEPHESDHDSER